MPSESSYPRLYIALGLLAISWMARWMRIRRPTHSTPVDLPLLLFLLSLLVSFFAAPDPLTAFARLTLFLGAFSLFYALINSPFKTIDLILNLLIVVLAFSGLIFISQYDWSLEASRFSPLGSIGIELNRLIPDLNLDLPKWNAFRNILASLLGVFIPILILQLYRSFDHVRTSPKYSQDWSFGCLKLTLLILSALLILLDLILTESRAPWLVYVAVLVLVFWWWLSRRIGERVKFSYRPIFLAGILLGCLILLVFITSLPSDSQLASLLPGPDTLTGRMEIYPQSYYLAGDTPFTGGGLGAFTALYSFYIRVTPFNAFLSEDTGVNLYLYILVEQGWLGLFSLILLLAIPLYHGLLHIDRPHTADKGKITAGVISLTIVILRGFIHALLGASRAIPFLLLPAGLIFAGVGFAYKYTQDTENDVRSPPSRRSIIALAVTLLLLFVYLLVAPAPRAAWYADLGTVRMAHIQLADWPSEAWEDGSTLPDLASTEMLFQKAIELNPHNRAANHRLGLIALLRQDFPSAARFLETAYRANPHHRGVIKSLGYTLVWMGEIERAIELLHRIPEAPRELDAYIFWWKNLDRPDLSTLAAEARARLLEPP
jgi:O-antigen ligase